MTTEELKKLLELTEKFAEHENQMAAEYQRKAQETNKPFLKESYTKFYANRMDIQRLTQHFIAELKISLKWDLENFDGAATAETRKEPQQC